MLYLHANCGDLPKTSQASECMCDIHKCMITFLLRLGLVFIRIILVLTGAFHLPELGALFQLSSDEGTIWQTASIPHFDGSNCTEREHIFLFSCMLFKVIMCTITVVMNQHCNTSKYMYSGL